MKRICQKWGGKTTTKGIYQLLMTIWGPVEAKMRQISQEQDEKQEEKEKTKSSQKRLGDIGVLQLDVRNEGSLKPKKARSEALSSIFSGSKSPAVLVCPDSQEEEESSFRMHM